MHVAIPPIALAEYGHRKQVEPAASTAQPRLASTEARKEAMTSGSGLWC